MNECADFGYDWGMGSLLKPEGLVSGQATYITDRLKNVKLEEVYQAPVEVEVKPSLVEDKNKKNPHYFIFWAINENGSIFFKHKMHIINKFKIDFDKLVNGDKEQQDKMFSINQAIAKIAHDKFLKNESNKDVEKIYMESIESYYNQIKSADKKSNLPLIAGAGVLAYFLMS